MSLPPSGSISSKSCARTSVYQWIHTDRTVHAYGSFFQFNLIQVCRVFRKGAFTHTAHQQDMDCQRLRVFTRLQFFGREPDQIPESESRAYCATYCPTVPIQSICHGTNVHAKKISETECCADCTMYCRTVEPSCFGAHTHPERITKCDCFEEGTTHCRVI